MGYQATGKNRQDAGLWATRAETAVADIRAKTSAASHTVSPKTNAFAKFDRMQEKVALAEAEVEALHELAKESADDTDQSFESATKAVDAEVEAELAELKKGKTKAES